MRWSMLVWLVATVVAAGLCAGLPARADTVFNNYTGINDGNGIPGLAAEAFTPKANFDFTGAAADFAAGTPPYVITFSLYTSSAGRPDVQFWSAINAGSPVGGLLSVSYGGTPILLEGGTTYFLAANDSDSIGVAVPWLDGGSSSTALFENSGGTWFTNGSGNLQFEVFGNPAASVAPGPGSGVGPGTCLHRAVRRRYRWHRADPPPRLNRRCVTLAEDALSAVFRRPHGRTQPLPR